MSQKAVSHRLRLLFLISIPLFMLHGLEEYFTGFYDTDPSFLFVVHPFENMSLHQATFLVFQIMVWLLLWIAYGALQGKSWMLRLLWIPAIIFIFELHHLVEALITWDYYPGMITALFFPIIGILFWKELLKESSSAQM